jgi:hypothetical protein
VERAKNERYPRAMGLRVAADAVALAHLGFVAFLVAGGFPARRRPALARAHLGVLAASAVIYAGGFDCPLTDLEKSLRRRGGGPVYGEGFIAHYLVSPVHPRGMTDAVGLGLFGAVVALNWLAYGPGLVRRRGLVQPLVRAARAAPTT